MVFLDLPFSQLLLASAHLAPHFEFHDVHPLLDPFHLELIQLRYVPLLLLNFGHFPGHSLHLYFKLIIFVFNVIKSHMSCVLLLALLVEV